MRRQGLAAALAATLSACLVSPCDALTPDEVSAIGRVVYAEAGNQPIHGKVAVLDTILNRIEAGSFGRNVFAVIEQRHAFEPVTVAGGWRKLPDLTPAQHIEFDTILRLKALGLIGDVSAGALFFQNEDIVRRRAQAGTVRPSLVGFDGMPKTAVIGQHTFYAPGKTSLARPAGKPISGARHPVTSLFVGSDDEEGDGAETRLVTGRDGG